jgi:DNA-binding winged helix-turn-helix (wHTH) protein
MRVRFGQFVVDTGSRQLRQGNSERHLSPKAFDLLTILLDARPRAISKADLHAALWPDTFVSDANLAMLIAEIRATLNDDAKAPRFVRTVPKFGYAFHGDATAAGDAPGTSTGFQYWLVAQFRQIPLLKGVNIVGRDPGLQVWLDSSGVSRQHARIVVGDAQVVLEDLNSKNGTQVGGRRIETPVALSDGDEIRFGSLLVTFRAWREGERTRTVGDA